MDDCKIRILPNAEYFADLFLVDIGVSGAVYAIDEFSVIKRPTLFLAGENDVELRIFKRLGEHPRIVKVLRIHNDMLVLERLMYPLRFRTWELRDKGQVPSTEEVLKWSAQAAEGMQHFHTNQVFQVDIGLHNILLDWDDNIKYCDFAGSSIDGEAPTALASWPARHPHTRDNEPTVQTEIFSLGSVIYEISTTYKAYDGMDEDEIQTRYAKGEFPPTEHLFLGSVILKCWRGGYNDAGEVAAEIRSIQRKTFLGDMKTSVSDILRRRREQLRATADVGKERSPLLFA